MQRSVSSQSKMTTVWGHRYYDDTFVSDCQATSHCASVFESRFGALGDYCAAESS